MAVRESIATGSTVEELAPKSGVTAVVWKWSSYKISDVNQTTVICMKNQSHHLKAEAVS